MASRSSPIQTLLLILAAFVSGCVSTEKAAPPVASFAVPPSGSKRAQLEQGREIYVTKCAKCHSPEPVHRYSPSRWGDILVDMIDEAKLNSAESAAVRAYVFAALKES